MNTHTMVVCGTFCDSRENEVLGFAEDRGELPCVHMLCARVARDMLLFDESLHVPGDQNIAIGGYQI